MPETTPKANWQEIVRKHWLGASIHGEGPHAVVVRCNYPFTEVHLFESHAEANALRPRFAKLKYANTDTILEA